MNLTIYPGKLCGAVSSIPSKSQAHRMLICAAFCDRNTDILCPQTNDDIEATAACLRALGADIQRTGFGYAVSPAKQFPDSAHLFVGESGSTLRFLLPIVGALGINTVFHMEGRLPQRPLSPLWEELERKGCHLSRPSPNTVCLDGKLQNGEFTLDGGVSSQFVSGLLFAFSLMNGKSHLSITGNLESAPYVAMTQQALACFGVATTEYTVSGGGLTSPGVVEIEGDWSNSAFFLAARFLGNDISISNLRQDSTQGDRAIYTLLPALEQFCTVSVENIPDLVPILSVVAAAKQGASFTGIRRLRVKESDRVASVQAMLKALGIHTEASENALTVFPGKLLGGIVDSCRDHRIAMSAAIAASVADGPVTIQDYPCVNKSYPSFWEVYRSLGGNYELDLR